MSTLAQPELVGRYAIYNKITAGGMATVHFGRLLGVAGFSRTVAIKRLHAHLAEDPQFLATMIDEARLAARIHHPNVVPTLDVVATNGELLIVMEYVRGESLGRLLRGEKARNKQVPLAVASAIAIGALHGLHAAHEAKSDRGVPLEIVHRDVSPQNILVGVDGVPRVIDFGVAKASGRLQTTTTGAVKGKIAYMAPEQLAAGDTRLAAGEVTRAADIYAMGVVLWEMLAGRYMFPHEHEAQLVLRVLRGATEPPSKYASHVTSYVDAVVMKALSLNPANRFSTAKEMAETLLRVLPPAFPTSVGRWVEEVASDALAKRGAELAEIESFSDALTVPPQAATLLGLGQHSPSWTADPPPASGQTPFAEMPTIASQPASMDVEAPRARSRTMRAGVVGLALMLTGLVTGFVVWRGVREHASVITETSVEAAAPLPISAPMPVSAPPPVSAVSAVSEGASASASVSASASASAPAIASASANAVALTPAPAIAPAAPTPASAPAAAPSPAHRSRGKSRAPKPPAPFRFSQPD